MIFDLSRISANNGWAMALTGAILVMLGLSILSFFISQLHKILAIFDQKPKSQPPESIKPPPVVGVDHLNDLESTAKLYHSLTVDLGDRFELIKLYQLAQKDKLPHPHLTLRTLREAGILIPDGEGTFSWKDV